VDPREIEQLYDRYSGAMYAVALRIVDGNRDAACRALEEAFLAVWDGQTGDDPASLLRAARDCALAARRASQTPPVTRSDRPTPMQLVEEAFFGGRRVDEIARELSLPVGEVRTMLHSGMAQLRNQFGAAR
jgi:DNA-directed RNA polymerase specialized sigma24 family protein